MKIGDIQLTRSERDILTSNGKWLNDLIINAAQNLLKQQFEIRGLQNTTLGQACQFSIMKGEFVQILHTTCHWTTISTIGLGGGEQSVAVYDSLYTKISKEDSDQICCLVLSPKSSIQLSYMNVQRQLSGSTCGLFAIAFATAICNGMDPVFLSFEEAEMRSHLLSCLQRKLLTPFPSRQRKPRGPAVKELEILSIYCHCRLQEAGRMIQCDHCAEWFHDRCEEIPPCTTDKWMCRKCC